MNKAYPKSFLNSLRTEKASQQFTVRYSLEIAEASAAQPNKNNPKISWKYVGGKIQILYSTINFSK